MGELEILFVDSEKPKVGFGHLPFGHLTALSLTFSALPCVSLSIVMGNGFSGIESIVCLLLVHTHLRCSTELLR